MIGYVFLQNRSLYIIFLETDEPMKPEKVFMSRINQLYFNIFSTTATMFKIRHYPW